MATPSHQVTRLALPSRLRGRAFAVVAVVLIAGLLAILGWSQWHGSTPTGPTAASGSVPVSGTVISQGGAIVTPLGGTPETPPGVGRLRFGSVEASGITVAGRHITRFLTTDALGRFRLRLPAGRYIVAVMVVATATTLSQEPHLTIVVQRGRPIHLRLVLAPP